jgi:hypothetical protein
MKKQIFKIYYQYSTSDFFIDRIDEKKEKPINSVYLGAFDSSTCEKITEKKDRNLIAFAYSKNTNNFSYSKPKSSYGLGWIVLSTRIDESLAREFVRIFDMAHWSGVPPENNYAYMEQKFRAFLENSKLLRALILTECFFEG